MKIGDLVEFYTEPLCWGVVVGVDMYQYEVFWMDGDRSWIAKKLMVKKCP